MPSKKKPERRLLTIGNSDDNKKTFISNYISTTKYTIINFLPKALLLQFRRYANIYFLVMAVLQSIPLISPLNPVSSIAPLCFVISLSMIREGYEDLARRKSDLELNSSMSVKYMDGGWKRVEWRQVYVGDIVRIKSDEFFPADIICLASSDPEGNAFIQTSSLDGEKNLKPRNAFAETQILIGNGQVVRIVGDLELEPPNSDLYQASGTISIGGDENLNITVKNFLLRGAVLKNTEWVVGVVAYTGKDTKIMKNAEDSKYKQSTVEKKTNQLIILIFVLQLIICLTVALFNGFWTASNADAYSRFIPNQYSPLVQGLLTFGTIFVLTNTMIPISLIISLEMVKLVQAYFVGIDEEMYNKESDRYSKVFTSSLNEELGQIEFIFSDKTGTLTCNKMEFKLCIINDTLYGDPSVLGNGPSKKRKPEAQTGGITFSFEDDRLTNFDGKKLEGDKPVEMVMYDAETRKTNHVYKDQKDMVYEFWLLLALCHDCLMEKDQETGIVSYQGESPDEITLVDSARHMGFMFIGSNSVYKNVNIFGETHSIEQLYFFEFNSDRKRASAIVRHNGLIKLMIKGADSIIYDRLSQECDENQKTLRENIKENLRIFSNKGFRTLCMAERIISEAEYSRIEQRIKDLGNSNTKEEGLQMLASDIETNLTLLGCTAVEDRLQDEVPETIRDMLKAGNYLYY